MNENLENNPIVKDIPYVLTAETVLDWQQAANSYPYLKNLPDLILVLSTPYPDGFFKQSNNGYPIMPHLESLIPVFIEPYPDGMWLQEQGGYPYFNHLKNLIPVLIKPYPEGIFLIDNAYPYMLDLEEKKIKVLEKPYPKGILYEKDSYPFNLDLNLLNTGVCCNCENLSKVYFAKTVREITDYAFYGTAITEVTIPKDCIIYEHSFPQGTLINRYE